MNHLNTTLIEGILLEDPIEETTGDGNKRTMFVVESVRFFQRSNEIKSETYRFLVETWGKTAETCFKALEKGLGVRVVGYLKQTIEDFKVPGHSRLTFPVPSVRIVAECVDFKPQFEKKPTA